MLKKRTKDSVVEVYRKMLTGEKLDDIKADDCIKEMVRTFLRHSNLSAYQIAQTTDLTSEVVGALRNAERGFKLRVGRNGHENVPFAVKWLLEGWKCDTLKLYGCSDETIKLAKRCIRIMEEDGKAPELYKAGISHAEIVSLLKLYESRKEERLPLQIEN